MKGKNFNLSIITPVRADVDLGHIEKAWRSVKDIDGNISWEWVVQIDGENSQLLQMIREMTEGYNVSLNDYDRSYGAAVARNTALALSGGDWILALDSDDWLLPDGVSVQSEVAREGNYKWVTGPALRVFSSGTELRPSPFSTGEIPVGAVQEERDKANGKMPVLATPILYRKDLIMYFGGWPALPRSEDVGLLYAINSLEPGFMTDEPFYAYRKWSGQTTSGDPDPRIRKAVLRHRAEWDKAVTKNLLSP